MSSFQIQPYADVHKAPKGRGDARPTAIKIVQDQQLTDGLSDKVIMITGCSSGLGVETAKALATTGATLYLTARNLSKAREALGEALVKSSKIHLLELDLTSLASVRACADAFLQQSSQLNILITNAGIRNTALGKTQDNFERQFGVNHLAHFLLFQLLKPTLLASSTPTFHSRVVALSSSDHRTANFPINFADLHFQSDPTQYTPARGYTQSKLANVYMSNEINRRYASQGLNASAVMPGGIMTGLQRGENGGAIREILSNPRTLFSLPGTMKLLKDPEQGAATTVWAAVARELEGHGGLYLENCGVAGPAAKDAFGVEPGYGEKAFDEADAKKLWAVSCDLVGVEDE